MTASGDPVVGVRFPCVTRLVACFQYLEDANQFMAQLAARLEQFGLSLALEKTRCMEFGRWARGTAYRRGEKPQEFTFLGYVFSALMCCRMLRRPLDNRGPLLSAT